MNTPTALPDTSDAARPYTAVHHEPGDYVERPVMWSTWQRVEALHEALYPGVPENRRPRKAETLNAVLDAGLEVIGTPTIQTPDEVLRAAVDKALGKAGK